METDHDISIIKNDRLLRDPSGTGLVGRASGVDLTNTAFAHPIIFYTGRFGDKLMMGDYYKMEGAPSYLSIFCPVCQNSLRISEDNKRIEYDPDIKPKFGTMREETILAGLEASSLGGLLSVERFGCTWELEPALRRSFGFAVCNWRVVIDNNIARDVR